MTLSTVNLGNYGTMLRRSCRIFNIIGITYCEGVAVREIQEVYCRGLSGIG